MEPLNNENLSLRIKDKLYNFSTTLDDDVTFKIETDFYIAERKIQEALQEHIDLFGILPYKKFRICIVIKQFEDLIFFVKSYIYNPDSLSFTIFLKIYDINSNLGKIN